MHSTLQNDRSNLLHKRPGCHTSSCSSCRVTVTCPLAADDLSEQGAEGGGTGDVIQKRFVRGSATTVAYLVDKAPNMAL